MINRVGETFGRLTIISFDKTIKYHDYWNCMCECGNIKSIRYDHLKRGNTVSCSCFIKEITSKRSIIHNNTSKNKRSIEYRSWESMKGRCYNKNTIGFTRYGGKGITVCDEWKNSFENFLKDMGKRPDKSYTLDRIDNSKGYYKENCKWSTKKEQANNRNNSHKLLNIITDQIFTNFKDAASSININEHTLRDNLKRNKINKTSFKLIT